MTSKTLRSMSLLVAVLFAGQTLALDARLAWADMVPGSVDNTTQQGTARTPDAVLGQTGEWDETTVVQNTDANGVKIFRDGTVEKIVAYVGSTDQPKTVERYSADGVLTHTLNYTYTKQGAQDYVRVAVKGLAERLTYAFTYAKQGDGSLKLTGLETSNTDYGSTTASFSGVGIGAGEPNSLIGQLAAEVGGLDGDWKFEFNSNGTVSAFQKSWSSAPYVQVTTSTFSWDASTQTLSASNASNPQVNGRVVSWQMKLATTGRTTMPHRIALLSSQSQGKEGSVRFTRDGLADQYVYKTTTTNGVYVSTSEKVLALGYKTYQFFGKPTVKMVSLDEVHTSGYQANPGQAMTYRSGGMSSSRDWMQVANEIVLGRSAWDYRWSLYINAGQNDSGDVAYTYETIDGKAYRTSEQSVTTRVVVPAFIPYVAVTRTDYTNVKIGSGVYVSKTVTSQKKTIANGTVEDRSSVSDSTFESILNSVYETTRLQTSVTEQRVGGVLVSGTKTDSSIENMIDRSNGMIAIKKTASKTEKTNYTDLSTEVEDQTSTILRNGIGAGSSIATKNVSTLKGVTKTTQSANYDAIYTQSQAQYADLWAGLKGAPAPVKKDVHQTDPATGKVTQTTYVNGDIKQFDADGLTTSFYEASTKVTTTYHPGTDKVKTVSETSGIVKTYDLHGVLIRQDEKNGDYSLFDAAGLKTFSFQASTGNRTDYATTGLVSKVVYGAGHTDLYDASGQVYRREFPNGSHQVLGPDGQVTLAYDASTGNVEHYTGGVLSRVDYSDGSLKVVGSDGSYQEFSKENPAKVVSERFSTPNAEGAIGYTYDSKSRKIKTIFADESYIITTYKDDSSLPESAINTESFFDKTHKHLRTLVYNSKGTQVRRMVTEDARNLDCFFDECWKEDMGLSSGWNGSTSTGPKIAVIETGSADSSHAMAVAGIANRVTGQSSNSTVFTANDHIKVIDAIKMAASSGFKVINLSLEFMRDGVLRWGQALGYDADRAIREFKAMLQSAVDFARNLGAVIVASAGNQGSDFSLLAELDGVVSVGATDYLGRRIDGSGFGSSLDFMASGYKVWSEGQLWTGTSFAAPMISGMIAGLMMAGGQQYTEGQILGAMQSSAQDLGAAGRDSYFGWGKVNASRAMSHLLSGLYQLFLN